MKKEWILMSVSVLGTLVIGLGVIRWLAPGLLGVSTDLQLVRLSEEVPPYFAGVFREEHERKLDAFLLKDPLTLVRAMPFFPELGGLHQGPTDLLGFRNRSVPNVVDVVAIGDSQTYGINAVLEDNWPSQVRDRFADRNVGVYGMAVGGWGAVQYLDMFPKALNLAPRAVVVAFYTGNDPLESFQLAYAIPEWSSLIPNHDLEESDAPPTPYPAPEDQWWPVTFDDGTETIFTPSLRLASNLDHPAVRAGYDIMAEVVRRISDLAANRRIAVYFTVIPTKELVFAPRVERESIEPPVEFTTLVANEQRYVRALERVIRELPGVSYVDVVTPLQRAALDTGSERSLYKEGIDGHPVAGGYAVIADAIAAALDAHLPEPARGLVAIPSGQGTYQFALVDDAGVWPFASEEVLRANGWKLRRASRATARDLAGLPLHDPIDYADGARFGPRAWRKRSSIE